MRLVWFSLPFLQFSQWSFPVAHPSRPPVVPCGYCVWVRSVSQGLGFTHPCFFGSEAFEGSRAFEGNRLRRYACFDAWWGSVGLPVGFHWRLDSPFFRAETAVRWFHAGIAARWLRVETAARWLFRKRVADVSWNAAVLCWAGVCCSDGTQPRVCNPTRPSIRPTFQAVRWEWWQSPRPARTSSCCDFHLR